MTHTQETPSAATQLFDLRTIVAVLFAGYGIVLTIIGLAATDEADLAKAGGININLWSGIAMLVLAVLFVSWVWLRPLRPFSADIPPRSAERGE